MGGFMDSAAGISGISDAMDETSPGSGVLTSYIGMDGNPEQNVSVMDGTERFVLFSDA